MIRRHSFFSQSISQNLWLSLSEKLPPTAEFQKCGTLWVAADSEERSEVERKHALYQDHDVPTRILSRSELTVLEPELRPDLEGALLVESDAVLYAPIAAQCLAQDAASHGAVIIDSEVISIGQGIVTLRDGRKLHSKRIVNAAGERSPELTPGLPVKKRKGHLAITDRYPGFLHHQVVELGYLKSAHTLSADSIAFNVQPRITGQVLIGSSRQFDTTSEVDNVILGRTKYSA